MVTCKYNPDHIEKSVMFMFFEFLIYTPLHRDSTYNIKALDILNEANHI